MTHDWISHPDSKLQLHDAIEKLPPEVPIDTGAEVAVVLDMVGHHPGRELQSVVGQVGIQAIIQGGLNSDEFIALPKHKEFMFHFANMGLVREVGLEFELHRDHIFDITGSPQWNIENRSVYCTQKVAAGEKVGFFIEFGAMLSNPLVIKKLLFSVSEMEMPKTYLGDDRAILPVSELVKFDAHVLPYLNHMADYGAIRISDTAFKILREEEIKFLDPKVYMAVPELDFREGAHEELFNGTDENDDDESECSFPF